MNKEFLILLLIFFVSITSCNRNKDSNNYPKVENPWYNPISCAFTDTIHVQIFSHPAQAFIWYTLDGSDPTDVSHLYAGKLILDKTTTIKALAAHHGYRDSDIISQTYTLNKVEAPIFNLTEDIYYEEQELIITCPTPNALIYYTINSITPFEHESLLYTSPIKLPLLYNHTALVKAIAYRTSWGPSVVVEKNYTFRTPSFVLVSGGHFRPTDHYYVSISTFYMGNYQVTQREWAEIMEGNNNEISTNPSFHENPPYHPVENISWYEAIVFCNRLSVRDGFQPVYTKNGNTDTNTWGIAPSIGTTTAWDIICDWSKDGFRLPTEMEWMYAANGGLENLLYTYSGSFIVNEVSWYDMNSEGSSHPIAQKRSNQLDIYDMTGNIWEYCWDWDSINYPTGHAVDPTGPISGTDKIQRGGSFLHDEHRSEITFRGLSEPWYRYIDRGFRVVRRD